MLTEKTILIVDDSDFDRGVLVKSFSRKLNCKILESRSGEECLELLKTQTVDILLLDVMMPNKDGNEVLTEVRQKFNPLELPVIMITGKSESEDIVKSLNLGANDYIPKPVNFEVAQMRITTQLKISELSREMGKLQQLAALHAMVATYNHEINNPLSIAITGLSQINAETQNPPNKSLKTVEEALWRVAGIVKKIKETIHGSSIDFTPYSGSKKMIKIK